MVENKLYNFFDVKNINGLGNYCFAVVGVRSAYNRDIPDGEETLV